MSEHGEARVVIVGDVLLDIDIRGDVRRLSPEAPVPVVADSDEQVRPGGAALAAMLASRWAEVVLIAPDAADDAAMAVREALGDRVRWIGLPWSGSTPIKTRLHGSGQPIARWDRGGRPGAIGSLPAAAHHVLRSAGAILVADYGLGATAAPHVRAALEQSQAPIVWDPHPRGARPVQRVRLATPNAAEASLFAPAGGALSAGRVDSAGSVERAPRSADVGVEDHEGSSSGSPLARVQQQAEQLLRGWGAAAVAVTLGGAGALLARPDGTMMLPAPAGIAATDTCGAGDCFAAAAAAALARGALPSEAVSAGVQAASDFVRAGAAGALVDWLRSPTRQDPVEFSAGDADQVVALARARGERIVATGGCFDLLHAGHIETLRAARALGDRLIVLVNSDESVRRLKGPSRPLQSQEDRAAVLRALRHVDAVAIFDEDDPRAALARLRPDVWVKGGDYTDAQLPEAQLVRSWGGHVITTPFVPGRSTTSLLSRAGALHDGRNA